MLQFRKLFKILNTLEYSVTNITICLESSSKFSIKIEIPVTNITI